MSFEQAKKTAQEATATYYYTKQHIEKNLLDSLSQVLQEFVYTVNDDSVDSESVEYVINTCFYLDYHSPTTENVAFAERGTYYGGRTDITEPFIETLNTKVLEQKGLYFRIDYPMNHQFGYKQEVDAFLRIQIIDREKASTVGSTVLRELVAGCQKVALHTHEVILQVYGEIRVDEEQNTRVRDGLIYDMTSGGAETWLVHRDTNTMYRKNDYVDVVPADTDVLELL